jgi:hypothetical protein
VFVTFLVTFMAISEHYKVFLSIMIGHCNSVRAVVTVGHERDFISIGFCSEVMIYTESINDIRVSADANII